MITVQQGNSNDWKGEGCKLAGEYSLALSKLVLSDYKERDSTYARLTNHVATASWLAIGESLSQVFLCKKQFTHCGCINTPRCKILSC